MGRCPTYHQCGVIAAYDRDDDITRKRLKLLDLQLADLTRINISPQDRNKYIFSESAPVEGSIGVNLILL